MCVEKRWMLVVDWDKLIVGHKNAKKDMAPLPKKMILLNQKLMKYIIYLLNILKIVGTVFFIHLKKDVCMTLNS